MKTSQHNLQARSKNSSENSNQEVSTPQPYIGTGRPIVSQPPITTAQPTVLLTPTSISTSSNQETQVMY